MLTDSPFQFRTLSFSIDHLLFREYYLQLLGKEAAAVSHTRRVHLEARLLYGVEDDPIPSIFSRTPPPALLHVNQESRALTRPSYEVIAGGRRGGITFCNFKEDIVSLSGKDFDPLQWGALFGDRDSQSKNEYKAGWRLRERFGKIERLEVKSMRWSRHYSKMLKSCAQRSPEILRVH